MDLAVSDSDVLIHLAKLKILKFLRDQFSKIYISEIIYDECVIQGKALQKEDAYILESFIKPDLIFKEKVNQEKIIEIMIK